MQRAFVHHVVGEKIIKNSNHIKVEGHYGKWYVVDDYTWRGQTVFLLEHETYGDEAASLIVDENSAILCDDVWNGISDLEYKFA